MRGAIVYGFTSKGPSVSPSWASMACSTEMSADTSRERSWYVSSKSFSKALCSTSKVRSISLRELEMFSP